MAGLSVQVPDETGEQPGSGLSLGQSYDDDEDTERIKAGMNSPKGDSELSLPETENDGNATPNTLRTHYDVNSPRKKNEIPGGWSTAADGNTEDADAASSAALSALVTQVPQDGDASPMTSGPPSDGDDSSYKTEQTLKTQTSQPGGVCSCFSALFSCCSSAPPPPDDGSTQTPVKQSNKSGGTAPLIQSDKQTDQKETEPEDSYTETEYPQPGLLPPLLPQHVGQKCLVLDLDETLVHSSFKPIPNPDFIIPVEIDNVIHRVYVMKRPFVDDYLLECSKHYEIVVFTASLAKYADPLLDKLDIHNTITHRLFRESCVLHGTAYVKDLRTLGRKLKDSIIVDNSPPSYLFQPINAIPILSWFDDQTDTQLRDILPVTTTTLKNIKDVRKILDAHSKSYRWLCQQANKPLELYD